MNSSKFFFSRRLNVLIVAVIILVGQNYAAAQNVKRVVVIKTDGLPAYTVENYVKMRDSQTGKSMLPWFDEIFYKNGARLDNFYVRGTSLSAPSWSQLDTGQHLQIKGNVEYDRFAINQYDYLNFIPFYINYGLRKKVDMPASEVMDQLKIPLLSDAFPFERKYTSPQLLGRGNEWMLLKKGFANMFPRNPRDFIDEWVVGLDFWAMTTDENERDILRLLKQNPEVEYLDYYSPHFDHVAHGNRAEKPQYAALKELDTFIGRVWTTIQNTPQAADTAIILVSDHGFNSDEKIYSQGFNLVKLLGSAAGGGHHIITKRRLMLDYSIKGIYPLVPLITTTSNESYYLKKQSTDYPTVLLDFDGNERASIHLRDSDLNVLQILWQQLRDEKLAAPVKRAVTDALFAVIERRAGDWRKTSADLNAELNALHEWSAQQQTIIEAQPKKYTADQLLRGVDKDDLRVVVERSIAVDDEANYREYLRTLNNLLALDRKNFDAATLKIEDYIPKGVMGENNSLYKLQNYIVGLSADGLTIAADGTLDTDKSFKRINYFALLGSQASLNNVQPKVSHQPIDFTAVRLPLNQMSANFAADLMPDEDPIWIYGDAAKQALILTRDDADGNRSYRYVPVADLQQNADGKYTFQIRDWSENLPLKLYEDADLEVPADRKVWLNQWHRELEWLRATHRTRYSNAIIGLNEQLDEHPFPWEKDAAANVSDEAENLLSFRRFQRRLTEPDLLVLANDHWNFDVRGFNPGGNHGSFLRVSTLSTLMLAGGANTGIPHNLEIEEPYDGLSFVPTVLYLMGRVNADGEPDAALHERGFRKFPGRIIKEFAPATHAPIP